mgnify:CR=1 FL=1
MEKISVIVPVYNVEKYLEKCLNSIINQTYKNLEIILVDDGSTDNSSDICDLYASKDNRIKVIHQENSGVSNAKNNGLKIATGELISFIDSDDTMEPNFFHVLYDSLIETNSDIALVGYKVVNEKGKLILDSITKNNLKKDERVTYEGNEIIKELLLQKTINNFGWCKLFKKNVLCNFKEGVTYEDIVFSVQVMMKAKRVVYTNTSVYNYLKRAKSITATISLNNLNDFALAIAERYNLIKENYNDLMEYNIYAFFLSTIAISTKYVICDTKYEEIKNKVEEFLNIIREYSNHNLKELLSFFTDYDILCLYLIKYNTDLYLNFLFERHKLKIQNKLS